jgi:hypothetical protein
MEKWKGEESRLPGGYGAALFDVNWYFWVKKHHSELINIHGLLR